jgi:hypothetical protein
MTQDNKPSTNKIITADPHDLPESTPIANEGMMRRDWLKNALMGGVGLGLFGIPMPSLASIIPSTACPRITRVSKNLTANVVAYKCTPCDCTKTKGYLITLEFSGPLTSNTACDESVPIIPDKSIAKGILKFALRSGICPKTEKAHLFGCHEGKLDLYTPAGAQILTSALEGTYGFDPRASLDARCCWPNAQGTLKGTGLDKLKSCTICTTYYLPIPFNLSDPCKSNFKSFAMQLDGTIMCPC